MRHVLAALVLLLLPPLSVTACLWDRDTPAEEAKGLPEVVAALTGRFERNPPLFYEMRLDRVTTHLQSNPEDLDAYDDAGVACDRLGRGDEAVNWMEKKRARLDELDAARPEVKEHWYRYHANLGTFLVHRWARQGADRSKLDEVKAARDQIAMALEINPNAHFGREKYQLRALEWILNPPKAAGQPFLPNLLGWGVANVFDENDSRAAKEEADPKAADDAVRGLAGLVVLGNAWESVDVFHALNVALQHDTLGFAEQYTGGRHTLAYLAWLRCHELIDAGKGSMLPDAPKGESLEALLPRPAIEKREVLLGPEFARLRAEADAWHANRTAFMMGRLRQGLHPDIDKNFWDGYSEPPAPLLPMQSATDASRERVARVVRTVQLAVIGAMLLVFGLVAVRSARRSAKAKPKGKPVDDWHAESMDRSH